MEEAFEPADELGLSHPQLGVAWSFALLERQGQAVELADQLRGEAGLQLLNRPPVDLCEPDPRLLVQRGRLHLLEELFDHAADPHDLRRLPDEPRKILFLMAPVLAVVQGLTQVALTVVLTLAACSPQVSSGAKPPFEGAAP